MKISGINNPFMGAKRDLVLKKMMICNNRDISKHLGRMQKITVKKDLCWGLNQTQKYSPRDNDPVNPQKGGESEWGNAGAAGARRMGPTLLSWTMRSRWADRDPVLPGEGGGGGGGDDRT